MEGEWFAYAGRVTAKEDFQEAEMDSKSALLCKDSSQRRGFGP